VGEGEEEEGDVRSAKVDERERQRRGTLSFRGWEKEYLFVSSFPGFACSS